MSTWDFERAMEDRDLIPTDAPPLAFGAEGRPWFVSLLLGAAGWLASLFSLVFVFLLFQPDSAAGATVLGVVMLGAGGALYAADRGDAFFEQLALALTLTGQLALMYAVAEATDSAVAVAAFTAAVSMLLVFRLPNHFARALSAFFGCVAWALFVRFAGWGDHLFDPGPEAMPLLPALVAWFVVWIPVAVVVHALIAREARWMATRARRVARPALTGLLVALSVGTWTSEPFAAFPMRTPPGEVPVNWLALWPLLGVAAALFAAVSAFRLRHRALIGVAIAGALLHLVHFYTLLGLSLVLKSYLMLALGAVLLIIARARPAGPPDPGLGTGAPPPAPASMANPMPHGSAEE